MDKKNNNTDHRRNNKRFKSRRLCLHHRNHLCCKRCKAHKRMIEALDRGGAASYRNRKRYHILYGTITCKRGTANRFCRTDNSKQDGQICTDAFRPWTKSNDRKRKENQRSHRSHEKKSCSLLSAAIGGAGALFVQMYHRVRDRLL